MVKVHAPVVQAIGNGGTKAPENSLPRDVMELGGVMVEVTKAYHSVKDVWAARDSSKEEFANGW